jgi:CDP-glucose 4,6-dehydratase
LPCSVVVVTTDKCYAPGHVGAYHESSPLGGRCPYSASKAAAEHAVTAYQLGYFAPDHVIRVATARGGNVIGPGDWGKGRLVPNAVRALKVGRPVSVFNKNAVRPWQFVEDVIDGYIMLGAALDGPAGPRYVGGWNFGPDRHYTVPQVVEQLIKCWGYGSWEFVQTELRETEHLEIDSTAARERLGWRPKFSLDEALKLTAYWYKHKEVP